MKNPYILLLSVSLPTPPAEAIFFGGLPSGAIEAIKAAYGVIVQIFDPPKDGFNLTLKLNLSKLPPDEGSTSSFSKQNPSKILLLDDLYAAKITHGSEDKMVWSLSKKSWCPCKYKALRMWGRWQNFPWRKYRHALLVKIASVREVVLGAPLRVILKKLASRNVAPNMDRLVAIVHRPNESFFLVPQVEKVTVVFPMRFKDSIDIVLATSFLQEFVEARRTAGLNNAPSCLWSPSPPPEVKGAPAEALLANAGFVTFVIFPRHVEGKKLDRTVWSLSTFHAYHVGADTKLDLLMLIDFVAHD
uniref:Arp2/3 complex 34 kDa subunit n=1 Tax=Fagus sylvatica TaxID=28930 RepID=A0A2N9EV18_FAGSY